MSARILFVHNHLAKFVQIDLALLREKYTVVEWDQRGRVVNLIALARAVAQSDLIVGWFASWHTFFPTWLARWLKRPVLLVVGGYDTANLPAIGYGNMRGGVKRVISRATMRAATGLMTNSYFTRDEVMRNAGVDAARATVIYHGLESVTPPNSRKENFVITAGNVDRSNLHRKGIESFVRAAAHLPEIPFIVIGAWRDNAIDDLRAIASPNVRFTGWVNDATLANYFARASVYVQPSQHEGFGLAVAEAMLYECVPVVTRVGALPEVVGDAGIYIDEPEPRALADGIRRALQSGDDLRQRARTRIQHEFPMERRRAALYALIDQFVR
jgi:glycosyltransferase involved in cell wall biosynthesis